MSRKAFSRLVAILGPELRKNEERAYRSSGGPVDAEIKDAIELTGAGWVCLGSAQVSAYTQFGYTSCATSQTCEILKIFIPIKIVQADSSYKLE